MDEIFEKFHLDPDELRNHVIDYSCDEFDRRGDDVIGTFVPSYDVLRVCERVNVECWTRQNCTYAYEYPTLRHVVESGTFQMARDILNSFGNNIREKREYIRANTSEALRMALYHDRDDIAELLIEAHGGNGGREQQDHVRARNSWTMRSGFFPLVLAVRSGNADLVKLLLDAHGGNQQEQRDHIGALDSLALRAAVRLDEPVEIVQLLLRYYGGNEQRDHIRGHNSDALRTAARLENAEVVRLLLEAHGPED